MNTPITDQQKQNVESILRHAEIIMKDETSKMPVGKAIEVANRFAEMVSKIRKSGDIREE